MRAPYRTIAADPPQSWPLSPFICISLVSASYPPFSLNFFREGGVISMVVPQAFRIAYLSKTPWRRLSF
jgi:hypothetical protein